MRKWSRRFISIGLLFTLCIGLFGCHSKKITVLVPIGSPQYATAYLEHSNDYEITTVSGAEALTAAFNDIGFDIILAPINLGAKMYSAKHNYQLSAVITWGNYYLIHENPIDLSVIDHMEIIAFGENQVPDFLLSFLLDYYEIEATMTYLDSVASITSAYLLDSSKIYLIAEPSLSILQTKKSLQYLDLQVEYESITGDDGFPQAGVFVNNQVSDDDLEAFIQALDKSISNLKDGDDVLEILQSVGIELPEAVYQDAITRSHIEFVDITTAKSAVITFLELIYDFNPNFIGALPDDSFYR